jgi:prephenate dehydrogenase
MKLHTLTIVGVGLIGGSIGLAARRRQLAGRIIGVGWRRETLDRARELGAIDEGTLELAPAVRQSEVSVFCTPVDRIVEQVLSVGRACPAGTLLTDAGSTKGMIVRALDGSLPPGVAFVGSHPLAGSEKRGPEHADADLFQGRFTIVTRAPKTDPAAIEKTCAFWNALGSRIRLMDADEHDRALALTSHLPHLVAAVLAGMVPPELFELTATGFRDTTRIAAGDPALWRAIFEQNRPALLDALKRFDDRLKDFRAALEASDPAAVERLLTQAKKARDALGNGG